jgi:hypothetical protein
VQLDLPNAGACCKIENDDLAVAVRQYQVEDKAIGCGRHRFDTRATRDFDLCPGRRVTG